MPPQPVQEYEGMLKGIGAGQIPPTCSKRSSTMARLQGQTHWVNDQYVKKGADQSDGWRSSSQQVHKDFGVQFERRHPPNKLASTVELRQGPYRKEGHWVSEAREHFQGRSQPPPQAFPAPKSQVHLGDDTIKYTTQYAACSKDPRSLPPPYVPEAASKWPLPDKYHIIHGGPTTSKDSRTDFPRLTANYSKISDGVRDPVLGIYRHVPPPAKRSEELIREGNRRIPPLGTLAAIRPHMDEVH
jgi:hypothetical protein